MRDASILVGGHEAYYREVREGNENTVLLLHGYSFSSQNWEDIDALRKISQWGFDVVAVDFPGFGRSELNPAYEAGGDYSTASLFVKEFLAAKEIGSAILIGPSMGGAIAVRTLVDYPETVSRIIAIAPAGFEIMKTLLYKISKEAVFIWGSDDPVIDISFGRRYHDLVAGSSLHIIRGADHVPYLKKTSQFFSLLKKLLLYE